MTAEQFLTLNTLRKRGYNTRVIKRVPGKSLLIWAVCTYTGRRIPLRLYPDGNYRHPRYDTHNERTRRLAAWQT